MSTRKKLGLGLIVLLAGAAGFFISWDAEDGVCLRAPTADARSMKLWSEQSGGKTLAQVPDFSALAEQLVPAVVSIRVEAKKSTRSQPWGGFHPWGEDAPQGGQGTGFTIHRDGLILTNYHVIENAKNIEVTFAEPDGGQRTMSARVVGTAPDYDVALLETDKRADAAVANLGDSDDVKIGDWVMAIGNPFGLSHSVSVGIVSAKGRREIEPSGRKGVYDFIQTDASINPGNSGGPLINMKGEVIGINTAVNAAGTGIGFAIPINMVKAMIGELKKTGHFARSWIGISIGDVDKDMAETFGLKSEDGALVQQVVANSPASKSGIKEGDIIVEFHGKKIRKAQDLTVYAGMAGVGKKVKVVVWRDGKTKTRSLVLEEFPDEARAAANAPAVKKGSIGMRVSDLNADQKKALKLDGGCLVREVAPGSVAARAGLRPGDIVLRLNGADIRSANAFVKGVAGIEEGAALRMQILRDEGKFFVAMRKPRTEADK